MGRHLVRRAGGGRRHRRPGQRHQPDQAADTEGGTPDIAQPRARGDESSNEDVRGFATAVGAKNLLERRLVK
jgi:hypothetical protein